MSGVAVHENNPSTGKEREEDPRYWMASQLIQICKFQANERPSLKKKMDRVLRDAVKVVLCTPHTRHTNMHINITHMCIHTHTNMLNSWSSKWNIILIPQPGNSNF